MSNQAYRDPNRGFVLFLLMTFILLMMTICSKILYPAQDSSLVYKWKKALVEVSYDNKKFCTGWFASKDGIIVTVFHVIEGWFDIAKDRIYVRIGGKDGMVYRAEILAFKNKAIDILFLKIDYKPEVWLDEFDMPEPGQNCIALGYPYFWEVALTAKVIRNMWYDVLGLDRIDFPGASGSVVLSEDGKVLGMITRSMGFPSFVVSHYIKVGLERLKDGRE